METKNEYINNAQLATQAHTAYHYGHVYYETVASSKDSTYQQGLNLGGASELEDDLFIGRGKELEHMREILSPGQPATFRKLLIVSGMVGVGKTELAITYAKHFQALYTSIFWLNAKSETTLKASLRMMAEKIFPLSETKAWDQDDIPIYISKWLSEHSNNLWLLILDNYEPTYDITKYYPYTSQGSIIVTTRAPKTIQGTKLKIEPVQEEDALLILQTRSGQKDLSTDAGASKLVKRLDYLPLALVSAGSTIKTTAATCEDYLQQYQTWKFESATISDHRCILYTTWNVSFGRLQEENPNAANLLLLLAYFNHQDIWYELIQSGTNSRYQGHPAWFLALAKDYLSFANAIAVLEEYYLVDIEPQTRTYSLRTCIHDWISTMNQSLNTNLYCIAADCISTHLTQEKEKYFSADKYQRLLGHAMRLSNVENVFMVEDDLDLSIVDMIGNLGMLLLDQGQYISASSAVQWSLRAREHLLGPNHQDTLETSQKLGNVYVGLEKLDEAEDMYRRTLKGRQQILGKGHPDTLKTIHSLAIIYSRKKKVAEAEKLCQRTRKGMKKLLGPTYLDAWTTIYPLGYFYGEQGKMSEVEQLYEKMLAVQSKLQDPDQNGTKTNLSTLTVNIFDEFAKDYKVLQGMMQGVLNENDSTGQQSVQPKEEVQRALQALLIPFAPGAYIGLKAFQGYKATRSMGDRKNNLNLVGKV